MNKKHKCLHNVQASVIEYSERAFLLIEGRISKSKDSKSLRKPSSPKSTVCRSRLAVKKQNVNQKIKHSEKVKSVHQNYLNNVAPTEERKTGFQYSFRQMPIGNCPSRCNYSKELESQNIKLRKQNRCLQDYIQVLQQKFLGGQKKTSANNRILENNEDNNLKINSILYRSQSPTQNSSNSYDYDSYFGHNININRQYMEKDHMQETKYTQ